MPAEAGEWLVAGFGVEQGRRLRALIAGAIMSCGGTLAPAHAQTAVWDPTVSNTNWYVAVPHLLAYATPSTSFANPVPIGDQTLWTLGVSTNGAFTGTSHAELAIGPITSTSDSTMQGFVTTAGQIRIVFTPIGGGATTIGLGQMRDIGGGLYGMEMQMMTGESLLVTHWATMLPYDPATFTPPPPAPVPTNASPQWAWTSGTPWRMVSPAVFGTGGTGRFIITDYKNGYFWGRGVGPAGSAVGEFTLLGSITPEGKVLFNTLSQSDLTNLYGDIAGDASAAQMLLGEYNDLGIYTGGISYLSLVSPYVETTEAMNNPAARGAAETLYRIAGTSLGLDGAMAPAIEVLNNLSGADLSNAISQTLPVLTGAAAQATYNTQRALQNVVGDRLDRLDDDHAAGRHIWLKPFGGILRQDGQNGVAGYRASGGGMAAGLDGDISPVFSLGGLFAYSYNSIDGEDDAVPNTLRVSSYRAGLYGRYRLMPDLEAQFQLDAGLNRNSESRSIAFMGSTALADYSSYTTHAGVDLRKTVTMGPALKLIPSLGVHAAQVSAESYSETGAGALNLQVDSQIYRELTVTAGVKGALRIASHLQLNAHAGVGYNALADQAYVTASYAGDGNSFVTYGLDPSPWLYSAGIGLTTAGTDALDLSLRYDIQASPTGLLSQSASVSLRLRM